MCVRVQIQERICPALISALLATWRLLETNCKTVSIAQFFSMCFQLLLHHIIDSPTEPILDTWGARSKNEVCVVQLSS